MVIQTLSGGDRRGARSSIKRCLTPRPARTPSRPAAPAQMARARAERLRHVPSFCAFSHLPLDAPEGRGVHTGARSDSPPNGSTRGLPGSLEKPKYPGRDDQGRHQRALASRPSGEIPPSSNHRPRIAWPAGLGASGDDGEDRHRSTAPATTAYLIASPRLGTNVARYVIRALSLNAVSTVAPTKSGVSERLARTGAIHHPCSRRESPDLRRKNPTSSGGRSSTGSGTRAVARAKPRKTGSRR